MISVKLFLGFYVNLDQKIHYQKEIPKLTNSASQSVATTPKGEEY